MNQNEEYHIISRSQLQALINSLAEYPYKNVAQVIANLSMLPTLEGVARSEGATDGDA